MKQNGFTLIEIIVALAVFAIMASITSYVLSQSFDINKRVKHQAMQHHQLDLALVLLRRETEQMINRPVRGNEQSMIPALIAHADGVEFTRCGDVNPDAALLKSNLKRVAYLCYGQKLIRRTWSLLDSPDRRQFHDQTLLEPLSACSFTYMDAKHILHSEWRIKPRDRAEQIAPLPSSIILHVVLAKWGPLDIYLPLTAGFYA